MAAAVKSVERITTTFASNSGALVENTENLSKSQDETKCVPIAITLRFSSNANDARANVMIAAEMIDNAGTPAVRVSRRGGTATTGNITVILDIVEFGANATVQQGSFTMTGASQTFTIATSVAASNTFIVGNGRATAADNSDDWNDALYHFRQNSGTQGQVERRAGGPPDIEGYWYAVTSSEFDTEYIETSFLSADTSANTTLTNTVTLANTFLSMCYESAETSDDPRDAWANSALTGTTTLTHYRNHGGTPAATATFGGWVIRSDSSFCAVQRYATDVDGQTTTNQTITAVDLTKAVIASNGHASIGAWPPANSTNGADNDDWTHTIDITATANVALQRQIDVTIGGSNNNVRYEVIEFELEGAAQGVPATVAASTPVGIQIVPIGPTIQTGGSIIVDAAQALFVRPAGPTIRTGASIPVSNAQNLFIRPQAPTIRRGSSTLVEAPEALQIVPLGPTVSATVTMAVDVSNALSLFFRAADPTIQTGASIIVSAPDTITIEPLGPSVQGGASVFVDAQSLTIQPQGPTLRTGASVFVEDPEDLLLRAAASSIQGGASIAVSDRGVINIEIPGPTISASTSIGAEVSEPVCLTLFPVAPRIVTGKARRYSVYRGQSLAFSKSVREHKFTVANKGTSMDSEDSE